MKYLKTFHSWKTDRFLDIAIRSELSMFDSAKDSVGIKRYFRRDLQY